MAKESVNKSQAIRDALAAHPEKSPLEISALLATQGLKVPPQYVSTIKSNAKAKARKGKRGRKAKVAGSVTVGGLSSVDAALSFIKSSGGLEQARAALDTIEQISAAL